MSGLHKRSGLPQVTGDIWPSAALACALIVSWPVAVTAQDTDADALRDATRQFFLAEVGLDWRLRDVDSVVATLEARGMAVDLILPVDGNATMVLLSPAVRPTEEVYHSAVYSVVTCPGSETAVSYQRFYHTGELTPFVEGLSQAAQALGIMRDVPNGDVPDAFSIVELLPSVNEMATDADETFRLWSIEGSLNEGEDWINYEAVVLYSCAAQD